MPYKDPAARAAAKKRWRQQNPQRQAAIRNAARTTRRTEHHVRFVGVDGEGVDRPGGGHDYNLLSVGAQSLHHPDGTRLGTSTIFDFLWDCHDSDPDAVMVGFYLSYDFAQWFRDLPEEHARMLLTTQGQAARARRASHGNPTPYPVRWGRWEFDVLPNLKRFKLRPTHTRLGTCTDCGTVCDTTGKITNRHPWLYVCDTGGLFQMSFAKVIDPVSWPEPVCTPAEYATILEGKAARSGEPVATGTPVDRATIAYNILENEILGRVLERYNQGLTAMGVKLRKVQWHGPGQAAQAWLKATAPAHTGPGDQGVEGADLEPYEAAQASYFGGWFEIMAHGPIPGTTWEYDINSAYPHLIANLPCLLHGTWTRGEGAPPRRAGWRLVEGEVTGSDPFIGPMPHRTSKGRVLRPLRTAGWWWQHEIEAARRAGLVDRVRWRRWWQYNPCDCARPFRAVRDLYQDRLKVGKNTPHGRALKLVYNSAYGKMAQSVGHPLFGNPVYASLITAGCRTMILDAIATHPDRSAAVIMVATDGVYFTSPHPFLTLDPQTLGKWDVAGKQDMSLFKPGVYWDDQARRAARSGARLSIKSRGVNERALANVIGRLDRQWARFKGPSEDPDRWPATDIVVPFSIVSPRQALNRDDWGLCGVVQHDRSVTQSSAPHTKRFPAPPDTVPDSLIRSRPWTTAGELESTPYDKRFGMDAREGIFDNQMIIPDGEIAILLGEILGIR